MHIYSRITIQIQKPRISIIDVIIHYAIPQTELRKKEPRTKNQAPRTVSTEGYSAKVQTKYKKRTIHEYDNSASADGLP